MVSELNDPVLGEERLPGDEILIFPVFPVARHLKLSTLVTFCTWPIALAVILSVTAYQFRSLNT